MLLWLLLYVCCSASGLVLIKMGINQSFSTSIVNGVMKLDFGVLMIVGLGLYVASFIISIAVMSKMNLTLFYPLSAGLIYSLVCLLGFFLLKEKIGTTQMIGMGIILVGIIVMNLKRA